MLHEYAVEPEALFGEKDNPQYQLVWQALGQFGIEHGRMVSCFPSDWEANIKELLRQMSDGLNKKSIEARLVQLKRRQALMSAGRQVENSNQPWRTKAHQQQEISPFHAIIQTDKKDSPEGVILTYLDLHEGNQLWKVLREKQIPRTAAAISECVMPLGRISTEMLFIDPYFNAQKKYTSVLVECICASRKKEKRLKSVEVHTLIRKKTIWDKEAREVADRRRLNELRESAKKDILPQIGSDVRLRFVFWNHSPKGERLHPRYVLTNKGGIRIDYGTSAGGDGELTDIVLMTYDLYRKKWRDYGKEENEPAAFEKFDEFEFSGKSDV